MTTIALAEHIAEVQAAMTVRHWQYGALVGAQSLQVFIDRLQVRLLKL